jgi:ribonuclease VapC
MPALALDTSAIIAILLAEPSAEELKSRIEDSGHILCGAPTLVECSIVLSGKFGRPALEWLEQFLRWCSPVVVDFSSAHWRSAQTAFLRYGKGRDPAALNFGDCLSYAVAKVAGVPLLYAGNDFSRTDLPHPGSKRRPR